MASSESRRAVFLQPKTQRACSQFVGFKQLAEKKYVEFARDLNPKWESGSHGTRDIAQDARRELVAITRGCNSALCNLKLSTGALGDE